MILFFLLSAAGAEWDSDSVNEQYMRLERMTHLFFNKHQLTSQTSISNPIPQINCAGVESDCGKFDIQSFGCTKQAKEVWSQWTCVPKYVTEPNIKAKMQIQPVMKNITCATYNYESCALFYEFEFTEKEKLRIEESEYDALCLTRTENAFFVGFVFAAVGLSFALIILVLLLFNVDVDQKSRLVVFSLRGTTHSSGSLDPEMQKVEEKKN